jgi:hypothetical protein
MSILYYFVSDKDKEVIRCAKEYGGGKSLFLNTELKQLAAFIIKNNLSVLRVLSEHHIDLLVEEEGYKLL